MPKTSPIWWKTKVVFNINMFNINKTKEEKHKQNTPMSVFIVNQLIKKKILKVAREKSTKPEQKWVSPNFSSKIIEFRKMVTITLCTRQQKRHWCIEQSYGLCGRGRGREDLGEWHWNM